MNATTIPTIPCSDCNTIGYFGIGDEIVNCERCGGDGYTVGENDAEFSERDWQNWAFECDRLAGVA